MSDQYNGFVSHRHEDDARVAELKQMLQGHGVDLRDSSVTSANPNEANSESYIKSILGDRIRWAGTVFVIVSPQTKNHEWVDWEVEYARKFPDKRIIGIYAPGAADCDLPEALERHANAVVAWNANDIIEAMEGKDNWQSADGSPRPLQPISRKDC
ncbi:MAG TPA: TIR domain-containing protein [Acidothermaceae bacterium]|jgi:hypothetical protein